MLGPKQLHRPAMEAFKGDNKQTISNMFGICSRFVLEDFWPYLVHLGLFRLFRLIWVYFGSLFELIGYISGAYLNLFGLGKTINIIK